MVHEGNHGHGAGAGYEVQDASIREIIYTGIGLAAGTILICFAVLGLFRVMRSINVKEERPVMAVPVPSAFPPQPRLQAKPWEELQIMRQNEDRVLTTYGWVNKKAGTVRIPIDRAMEIVVEKGLPVRTENAPASPARPSQGDSQRAAQR
jgi:hypothetical protein